MPKVAERRRRLLEYRLDPKSARTKNSSNKASDSSSPATLTLSAEGLTKLMEVVESGGSASGKPLPPQARSVLVNLVRAEVSKGVLELGSRHVIHAAVRQTLQRFTTDSTSPVPKTLTAAERKNIFEKLSCFALVKAPTSTLSPKLQEIKAGIIKVAVEVERGHKEQQMARVNEVKAQIGQLLRGNNESEFPFAGTFLERDEDPEILNFKVYLGDSLVTLPQRKPEVWTSLMELVNAYAQAGCLVEGYFQIRPRDTS